MGFNWFFILVGNKWPLDYFIAIKAEQLYMFDAHMFLFL